MTTAANLRDKSRDQLEDQLTALKKEQFNLRFQRASGQLEKTNRVRDVRKDIARIQTILGEWSRHPEVAPKGAAPKPAKAKAEAPKKEKKAPAKETKAPAKKRTKKE